MTREKLLYINPIDMKEIDGIALSMIFDFSNTNTTTIGKRIDDNYVSFSHTKFGVRIDQELGDLWVKNLKNKKIRALYRYPPKR